MPLLALHGTAKLVAMFRSLDAPTRKQLLPRLAEAEPMLAQLVDSCSFLYQDLGQLPVASLAQALRLIPEERWLVAWKLTGEALQRSLLAAMTPGQAQKFIAAVGMQPALPRAQVIKTQSYIAGRVRELLASGKLASGK